MTGAIYCNEDEGHRCDADGGDPCCDCKAEEAHHRRTWLVASPEERNPKAYREQMIAAGRGILVRETNNESAEAAQ